MENGAQPAVHELLHISELLRIQAVGARKTAAMLPLIADQELRGLMEQSVNRCKEHARALVGFCKTKGLVH